MKNIRQVIPISLQAIENTAYVTEPNEIKINPEATDFVNHLFKIFEVHIKTFSVFASSPEKVEFAKKEWIRALSKHRITREQIIIGAEKVREKSFTYMLNPSEFIDLCLDKNPAKPQTDTRSLEDFSKWESKSDEEKKRLQEAGKNQCADLLWRLRRGF